jgi:glycosyltransferase involved in cell wall biosynthesis
MKLSVVVPVFNEIDTIDEIVLRIQAVPMDREIIIVDDCSTDGTRERLEAIAQENANIKVFYHKRNKGKGSALRTGFNWVTGDVVIIQDADLEYNPNEYPTLLDPIISGKADVVFGSRFLAGPHRVLYFWHYVGNRFVTLIANIFSNLNLTDMETCYKAFRSEVLQSLKLKSDRFGFEPEFTLQVAKRKWRIYEVPISYDGRSYSEGKKITWKDGLLAVLTMMRVRLLG